MPFVNNLGIQTSFLRNQQIVYQVLASFFCDSFGVASSHKFRFADVLARRLVSTQILSVNHAFMDVDELWEARIFDYTGDIFLSGHRYKHVIASRFSLATVVEDLQAIMVERAVAAWKQTILSRFSFGRALHPLLDEFGSVPLATQIRDPTALAVPPTRACVTSLRRFKIVLMNLAASHYITASVQ